MTGSYSRPSIDFHLWNCKSNDQWKGPRCKSWRFNDCPCWHSTPVCQHGSHPPGKSDLLFFRNSSPHWVPQILYTIYSPAEHNPQTVHKTKEEGDEEEENEKDEPADWSTRSKAENEKAGLVRTDGKYD